LLAGRKLLLADDSVTIQKVIDLTFADEGVRVVSFGDGQQAIDNLEEVAPDIVLADIFMPSKTGYEVCKYVKENEKLKHIPVMLLVGSFEPFDEAEARRVGADDILTKPFQSIRRLIDRVGALVNNPPAKREVPTAELPKVKEESDANQFLSTSELEIATADTLRLPDNYDFGAKTLEPAVPAESVSKEEKMESSEKRKSDSAPDASDVLLDLGEFEPVHAAATNDDFVLDLEDTIEVSEPAVRPFVEPQVTERAATAAAHEYSSYQPAVIDAPFVDTKELAIETQAREVEVDEAPAPYEPSAQVDRQAVSSAAYASGVNADSLSPEMIDAIARRVVEMMSDKVVREIAWEVVPDLAELLIQRRLAEKESQTK
jgi:CheY-like chemotaxis protein